MKTKKIYVVGNEDNYAKFIQDYKLVFEIKDADIIIFTGGADVSPHLYGCEKHPTTYNDPTRDVEEMKEFSNIQPHQLVIGICRGSQFLCVMNGGKLVQNVKNHAIYHTHTIYEKCSGKLFEITSTHHQMQYPFDLPKSDYECLFHSNPPLSSIYEGDKIIPLPYEPEIVLYHKFNFPKCLAIQGHPETMRKEAPIINRLNEIINNLLKNED